MYKTLKSGLVLGVTCVTVAACDNGDTQTPIAKKTPDTSKSSPNPNPGPNLNPGPIDLTNEINDLFDTSNLTDGKLPDGSTPAEKLAGIKAAIPAGSESMVKPILESFKGNTNNNVEVLRTNTSTHMSLVDILDVTDEVGLVKTNEDNLIVIDRCVDDGNLTYIYKDASGKYTSVKSDKDMKLGVSGDDVVRLATFIRSFESDTEDEKKHVNKIAKWILENIDKLEKYEYKKSVKLKSSATDKYLLTRYNSSQIKYAIVNHEGKKLQSIDANGNPIFG